MNEKITNTPEEPKARNQLSEELLLAAIGLAFVEDKKYAVKKKRYEILEMKKQAERRVPNPSTQTWSYIYYSYGWWLVLAIIGAVITAFLSFMGKEVMGTRAGGRAIWVCYAILAVILLIVCIKGHVEDYKRDKSSYYDYLGKRSTAEKVIPQLESEIKTLEKEIKEQSEKNEQFIAFLPKLYRYNLEAVSFMAIAVESMRADTLKEAINLWEDHKMKEQANAKIQATIAENAMAMQAQIQAQTDRVADLMRDFNASQENINDELRHMRFNQEADRINRYNG